MKLINYYKNRYNKGEMLLVPGLFMSKEHWNWYQVNAMTMVDHRQVWYFILFLIFIFMNIDENCKLEKKNKEK